MHQQQWQQELAALDAQADLAALQSWEGLERHYGYSAEVLAGLRPAFDKAGGVTAGNASGINDGAAALVIMSEEKAKELGARAIPLNVSAPFHCPLMQPAADRLADALSRTEIKSPKCAVYAKRSGRWTLKRSQVAPSRRFLSALPTTFV